MTSPMLLSPHFHDINSLQQVHVDSIFKRLRTLDSYPYRSFIQAYAGVQFTRCWRACQRSQAQWILGGGWDWNESSKNNRTPRTKKPIREECLCCESHYSICWKNVDIQSFLERFRRGGSHTPRALGGVLQPIWCCRCRAHETGWEEEV